MRPGRGIDQSRQLGEALSVSPDSPGHGRPPAQLRAPARGGIRPGRIAVLLWLVVLGAPVQSSLAKPGLKTFETRYYVIHTDLDPDAVRAAAVRMTAMAEEYHRRTRGFSGTIRRKLPFYLFRKARDYYDAGGAPGTGGFFTGRRLLVKAGNQPDKRTWHLVQHEGFHQFAHAVIRGRIPRWVNEGLAEYFAEAVFTGDGFVVGIVPPGRLARLKRQIKGAKLKPFTEIMQRWDSKIGMADYDQAWSMIHFLVHGDKGRYVRALSGFMNDIGRRLRYEQAWLRNFGRDVKGFEARWRSYWLNQRADPTRHLYTKAVVATMTSFFARAVSRQQEFGTFEDFFQAAQAGKLKVHQLDWLPPKLLSDALAKVRRSGEWSIERPPRRLPRLVCRSEDGTKLTGTFVVRDGRVTSVTVDVESKGHTDKREKNAPSTIPAAGQAS